MFERGGCNVERKRENDKTLLPTRKKTLGEKPSLPPFLSSS
jgi:hypothetical protein